jgi:hypothetical protein
MKVAILAPEANAIADHAENCSIGMQPDTEAIFLGHPLQDAPNLPTANSSIGVRNILLYPELKEKLFTDHLEFSSAPTKTVLFALFNGKIFSEWMEISHSGRFMTKDVGPELGFTTGVGMKVDVPVEDVVKITKLTEALTSLGYRGEVAVGISSDYCITDVSFGHSYGFFGMFAEVCKLGADEIMEFIFGNREACELYPSICVSNLVSQQPFPNIISTQTAHIGAPHNAEKHLWRVSISGLIDVALVTVHGTYLGEARKRLRRTLENMRRFNDAIQYRTDYGYDGRFVLMREAYDKSKVSPYQRSLESA